jgi:TM2 domain-containing membrane protein YozV
MFMKKTIIVLLVCCSMLTTTYAAENHESYIIDDQKIEQLFNNSTDVSLTSVSSQFFADQTNNMANKNAAYYAGGDKNFAAAVLLNFFLGGLGIHRLYLGTKTLTWVGYILTCGGIFGIVPLIDFIVLIIHNDDISPYVDNPKFFMWSGQ